MLELMIFLKVKLKIILLFFCLILLFLSKFIFIILRLIKIFIILFKLFDILFNCCIIQIIHSYTFHIINNLDNSSLNRTDNSFRIIVVLYFSCVIL